MASDLDMDTERLWKVTSITKTFTAVVVLETEQVPFFWHNGATLGCRAFAGSLEDGRLSIIVLMNMMPAAQQHCTAATETATAISEIMLEELSREASPSRHAEGSDAPGRMQARNKKGTPHMSHGAGVPLS